MTEVNSNVYAYCLQECYSGFPDLAEISFHNTVISLGFKID